MFQIARSNEFTLRMFTKPAFPMAQQFFDLCIPNPVVLIVIKNRNQDVEVSQQIPESSHSSKCHAEIPAVFPLREFLVKRMTLGSHFIAYRLKEASQQVFSAPARKNVDSRFQWNP